MDSVQPEGGCGRGRGRARILQTLQDAVDHKQKMSGHPGEHLSHQPSTQTAITDNTLKAWIIKELIPKMNGIWSREIPKMFEENFNITPSGDLITKIQSWTDIIVTEKIVGGEILKLVKTEQEKLLQGKRESEKPKEIDCKSDNAPEVCGHKKVLVPEKGRFMDVHVLWANSPVDFCIMPYSLTTKFKTLMLEMNHYFHTNSKRIQPLQSTAISVGKLCAGLYNGGWYRVIVRDATENLDKISVYLSDYCYETKLSGDKLAELPREFQTLPSVGMHARIHGVNIKDVAPVDGGSNWSEEARTVFNTIALERDFVAYICDRNLDDGTFAVRLIDTSDDKDDVIIDEVLEELDIISRC